MYLVSMKITMAPKRSFEDAFKRQPLQEVKVDDFYVEHTIYKVTKENEISKFFDVKTTQNSKFQYHDNVIKETATSATLYTSERKACKTELVELFSNLSVNDIWFATFLKLEKDRNWQEELVQKIQSMKKDDAVKYVKKDFTTFGKINREIVGQKIDLKSHNNYYTVRDLNIYFDELKANGIESAEKNSVRQLDVNTIQSLIFNNVKYVLK